MKKVTNLNEENYFNMCGCSSSFDGNKGYGFPKDEDYDNGYNTPSYSNASGVDFDGDNFDTDSAMESSPNVNFDNFLNASKKKKKIDTTKLKKNLGKTQNVVKKAVAVADILQKPAETEMVMSPVMAEVMAEIMAESKPEVPVVPVAKNKTLMYVGIGAIVLVGLYIGYTQFYGKKAKA
jgi:hypothetical protein